MTVARFETIRFPTGTVQVWALTPHAPASVHNADDAATVWVVAVFLKGRGIDGWTPMPAGFEAAVAHYQRLAAQENHRRANNVTRPPVAMGAERAAATA
jgi:hypothetical protein